MAAMKRILDSSFQYTPSYETDVRKTFERVRREMQETARPAPWPGVPAVTKIVSLRSGKPGA